MPVDKAESNRRYHEKQVKKFGSEQAYKDHLAMKKRESRMKKKKPVEPIESPPQDIPELVSQLKALTAKLSSVGTNCNDIKSVIQYVQAVKPTIEKIETNRVRDISEAIYLSKSKSLKSYKLTTHQAIMKKVGYIGKKIDPNWTFDLFKDTKRVLNFINSNWSNQNTRTVNLQAISGVLKYLSGFEEAYKIYSTSSVKNRQELTLEENKLQKTKKESDSWLDWKDLEVAGDNKALDIKTRTIISLYTKMPPRRLSMIRYLIRGKGTDMTYNYLDGDKIILNNYKTFNKYGTYTIQLPKSLQTIMNEYINHYNIKIGDLVFPNSNGKMYSGYISTIFKKAFERATGKAITQQTLRHIYVSHRMKEQLNLNDKIQIARELGHSLSMFERYNRL